MADYKNWRRLYTRTIFIYAWDTNNCVLESVRLVQSADVTFF